METRTIPAANWTKYLINAIMASEDGDEIIVSTEAQKELALVAMKRMCPNKNIVLTVTPRDPRD